jgi:RecB family endonuclease NucS
MLKIFSSNAQVISSGVLAKGRLFVVIELKRGRSSDSAVGQVLRYIGWVNENLAKPGQRTRGIIIAKEVDDALRYAVKELENVRVLTYKVDFKLSAFAP